MRQQQYWLFIIKLNNLSNQTIHYLQIQSFTKTQAIIGDRLACKFISIGIFSQNFIEIADQIYFFIMFDQKQKKKMLKKNPLNLASRKTLPIEKASRVSTRINSKSSQKLKISEVKCQQNIQKESLGNQNSSKPKSINMNTYKLAQKLNNKLVQGKGAYRLRLSRCSTRKQSNILNQDSLISQAQLSAIRQILREDIANLLLESKIIQIGHMNHVTLGLQTLLVLFQKIVQCFFQEDYGSKQSQLSFLNISLQKIKKITLKHISSQKLKKCKIQQHIQYNFGPKQYDKSTSILKSDVQSLLQQKQSLQTELKELQAKITNIASAVASKKHELLLDNDQIIIVRRDLEQSKEQLTRICKNLEDMRENLKKTEEQYIHIAHFVDNQNKNKLVKMASRDYKEIQSDIYEFAVYLQANELATSMMYESIPVQNQNFVIEHLQQSLKELNRTLIGNCEMSLEEKGKLMRDFVLDINQQYRKKVWSNHIQDEQQQKLIQFKTRCIRKYVSMMQKWLSNWNLKQEFLVNLRKQFANIALSFSESLEALFEGIECEGCNKNCSFLKIEIASALQHLKQNYALGNSFY